MILHDSEGRPKFAIDLRFMVVVLVLGAALLVVFLFHPNHKPIGSCAEMNLKGFTRVTPKNSDFNPALDKNHDGVEC